jgi:hypothetical protein
MVVRSWYSQNIIPFSEMSTPTVRTNEPPVMWVNVKLKFTLEQAAKAQRWGIGIALLFP